MLPSGNHRGRGEQDACGADAAAAGEGWIGGSTEIVDVVGGRMPTAKCKRIGWPNITCARGSCGARDDIYRHFGHARGRGKQPER